MYRRILNRTLTSSLILIMVAVLLAACGQAATPAPAPATEAPAPAVEPTAVPVAEETEAPEEPPTPVPVEEPFEVVMGIAANTGQLHPNLTSLTTDWIVLEQIMDPLIILGPDGTFQPWLATGWEVSGDGLTWTFKLREGVTFHNGEPFNAEAVKFTFDDALSVEGSSQTTVINELAAVNVIDDYTVETVTARTNPIWLSQIAHLFMMPPAYTQEVGPEGFNEAPVGTGAFKFVEWVKDDHVTVEKNPDWWNGEPQVDLITFRTIPEASGRVASLLAGEADIIEVVPFDSIQQIEDREDLTVLDRGGAIAYIGLDTLKDVPTQDRRVRQAMNYAVDAESIAEFVLSGRAQAVPGGLWPVSPGWDPDLPIYNDKDKARELLAEAGYPDGFEIEFSIGQVQGMLQVKEVAQAVQAQLAEVGITANIVELETAAMFEAYANKEFEMYFFPWRSNPEAARHFNTLLHSTTRGYYYANPEEMDPLIDDFMTEMDTEQRYEAGRVLNEFVHEDAPWIFMYVEQEAFGVNTGRVKWDINPAAVDMFFGTELSPASN
ncbi:MAG: ABC transporter substrate-binding protein [Anaerolineales bacterium]|nr:MAG: ABC transporter substrate-binding protein [Anaerolineales bacterium]